MYGAPSRHQTPQGVTAKAHAYGTHPQSQHLPGTPTYGTPSQYPAPPHTPAQTFGVNPQYQPPRSTNAAPLFGASSNQTQPPASGNTTSTSTTGRVLDDNVRAAIEEEDVVAGVTRGRRIVLTRPSYLLIAFVLVWGLSITGTVFGFRQIDKQGYPPTIYSNGAVDGTMKSLIFLTIVTPLGLTILKFRIANLLIGFVYMYLLVLYLIYPSKAVINGIYSLAEDTEMSIIAYATDPHGETQIHPFWSRIQSKLKCCGTKEIDRVEDWPRFTKTPHIPYSCCTEQHVANVLEMRNETDRNKRSEKLYSENCGNSLAASTVKGFVGPGDPAGRMFSGFFVSVTDREMASAVNTWNLIEPAHLLVKFIDVLDGKIKDFLAPQVFNRNWKSFFIDSVCNTVDKLKAGPVEDSDVCSEYRGLHPNDVANPPGLYLDEIDLTVGILNSSEETVKMAALQCATGSVKIHNPKLDLHKSITQCLNQHRLWYREPATTLGRELLLRFDVLTSYIYEFLYANMDADRERWAIWEIPLDYNPGEIYPYKLSANLLRTRMKGDGTVDDKQLKKMYYFSRGIAENFLLEGLIHRDTCEFTDKKYHGTLKSKIARDLNKRWRTFVVEKWKNSEDGLGEVFLQTIHNIVVICICVSGACMVCVLIVALVFWQYYSRIKAEEYANLALPKEFAVLHLRRGSGLEADDLALNAKQRALLLLRRRARNSAQAIRRVAPERGE